MMSLISINKSMGFGQSLLEVLTGDNTIPENQISFRYRFIENTSNFIKLQILNGYHKNFGFLEVVCCVLSFE